MNENTPLSCDFLIMDEASMLDLRLAAALVRSIPPQAHLLLVGDADQLPSVGSGNVLRTNDSGLLTVTRLEVTFRQAEDSGIVGLAHGILGGKASPPSPLDHPSAMNPIMMYILSGRIHPGMRSRLPCFAGKFTKDIFHGHSK